MVAPVRHVELPEISFSPGDRNLLALLALAAVAACSAAGGALDWHLQRRRLAAEGKAPAEPAGRPRFWALGMLTSSYALLVPGLYVTVIAFDMKFSFFGIEMPIKSSEENTVELVGHSVENGAVLAAAFITLYAMVVPVLKLILLVWGHAWGRGTPRQVRWARRFILTVQAVSKWASPDMFAYIMFMCLMRGLNSPPNLSSRFDLGLGFSCFSIFCLGSTFATLGISAPTVPADSDGNARELAAAARQPSRLRGWPSIALHAAVVCAFVALLAVGMVFPCMEMSLDMDLLYEENPDLKKMSWIIDSLDLPELMHEEVSIWQSLRYVGAWAVSGEVNSGYAFVMVSIFMVLLPLVDMVLLVVASCAQVSDDGAAEGGAARNMLAISKVVQKLSMLDVAIMGVLVVVCSMRSMRDHGVILNISPGLWGLLGAELCHYLASYLAHCQCAEVPPSAQEEKAAEGGEPKDLGEPKAGNPSDNGSEPSSDNASLGHHSEDHSEV